jgi:hypothetical protein
MSIFNSLSSNFNFLIRNFKNNFKFYILLIFILFIFIIFTFDLSYDDCVLSHIKYAKTNSIASLIIDSCDKKWKN